MHPQRGTLCRNQRHSAETKETDKRPLPLLHVVKSAPSPVLWKEIVMSGENLLRDAVVDYCATKLHDSLQQIEKCLHLLTGEQIWHRFNEVSNSVGVLVLHLTGNVNQWINQTLGGDEFERNRPAEFAQRDPLPTDEILAQLSAAVNRAGKVIRSLSAGQLTRMVQVQGYTVSGAGAVIHVVEHFSLHTGQIVYATKLLINQDLSLYDAQGRRIDGRTTGTP